MKLVEFLMSWENRKKSGMDKEFTGPFPRYSGAISAVTNGSPEDINQMPASDGREGTTIYDGSDLDRSKASPVRRHPGSTETVLNLGLR
jgi:hypothetical protein